MSKSSYRRTWLIVPLLIAVIVGVLAIEKSRAKASAYQLHINNVENGLIVDPFMVTGIPPQTESITKAMEEEHTPAMSIAVIDNNRIAWARAYGVTQQERGVPATIHTQFSAGSLTKFITTVAVLRLVDQGKLDLNKDVQSYLTSWRVPGADAQNPVTLRNLLSHTAGFSQHFAYSYPLGQKLPTTLDILTGVPPARNSKIKLDGKPGEKFDYSSAGFEIVQKVLEDVTGKSYAEVIQQEVFVPAGMIESSFEQPSNSNYYLRAVGHADNDADKLAPAPVMFPELASSGLWTTPSDLARLLICLGKQPRFLSEPSYEAMVTPVRENSGLGVFLVGDGTSLRFRARTSDGRPEDGYTGWLTSYVDGGKGAVVLANSHTAFSKGFATMRAIAREYDWPGYLAILPKPQYSRDLQAYVGSYQMDEPVIITNRGGALFVSYSELRNLPLLASGEDSFVVNFEPVSDFVLKFHLGNDGRANLLSLTTGFRHFEAPRIAEKNVPRSGGN
ncbi:MAG: serine hydrolase domain-containing protein [Candidatus Sulfotelmatobacter sp.]